ncbi:MAG: glucokinase [Sphingobium sp.]
MTIEIVAVDIGGTNARFARARVAPGAPPELGTVRAYRVADHAGLAGAWDAFARAEGTTLPERAVIAIAAPITDTPMKLTNSPWIVDPSTLGKDLGLADFALINDFAAMAHGVAALPRDRLDPLFGPDSGLPDHGIVTVAGPGTGLGVAMVATGGGNVDIGPRVFATEGGHIGFAPFDAAEDHLLATVRRRYSRVSAERIVSGPGLANIRRALAEDAGVEAPELDDAELWKLALSGGEALAGDALAQLCRSYGSVAGDLALAHLAGAVVLTGGLTARMKDHPAFAGFGERFVAKGRYRALLETVPVYHAGHPELGLYGAAAAGKALIATGG